MNVYWLEQTDADVPAENDWLSANEAICLNAMRFAKRRADWRLGRWTAKRALSTLLNAPVAPEGFRKTEIRPAPSGAPEVLIGGRPASVTISLSHRSGMAICAVARSVVELGCDLEVAEPRSDAFLADYLTIDEQALVARATAADRNQLLALLWSAKESALKALRTGLRLDTRCVNVQPFVAPLHVHGWSPLTVRYTADGSPEHDSAEQHSAEQVFHGWWRAADKIVQTVVAAPVPDPPIPLAITGSFFESASRYA